MSAPKHISLGPLTRVISNGARWQHEDLFPAWQEWADEVERVLEHLVAQDQFERFLPRLRDVDAKHRDAKLAEARVSFFLFRNRFRIVEYDPAGADDTEGDLVVQWRDSAPVFVEIKAPSWRGELIPRTEEDKAKLTKRDWAMVKERLKRPKDIQGEARWIDPAGQALSVVEENGLKKLFDNRPNLIVVVDDFFVTTVGVPILRDLVATKLADPKFERVGAIMFLKAQCADTDIEYRIEFVENETALPLCRLPEEVRQGFNSSAQEARRKRRTARRQRA